MPRKAAQCAQLLLGLGFEDFLGSFAFGHSLMVKES